MLPKDFAKGLGTLQLDNIAKIEDLFIKLLDDVVQFNNKNTVQSTEPGGRLYSNILMKI